MISKRLIQKAGRKAIEQNALGNKSFEKSPCIPRNPEGQLPSQNRPWLREDLRRPSALTKMTTRPPTARPPAAELICKDGRFLLVLDIEGKHLSHHWLPTKQMKQTTVSHMTKNTDFIKPV